VDNIHKKWWGNYSLLEAHHGYIQWLFPIREDGLNSYADQLQLHEAKAIAADPIMQGRVIKSYELMLDFYGMRLADRQTGAIERNPENWKSRYQHLNRSFHNYLRITRILKCLGEVGLERFKIHFITHVLTEIYENELLRNCKESCIKYWAQVLRNDNELQQVNELITKHDPLVFQKAKNDRRFVDSDSDEDSKPKRDKNNRNSLEKKEKESTKAEKESTSQPEKQKTEKEEKKLDSTEKDKDNKVQNAGEGGAGSQQVDIAGGITSNNNSSSNEEVPNKSTEKDNNAHDTN